MIRDGTGFAEAALDNWLANPHTPPDGGWSADLARAMAWALKARCYALWSSEPAKAVAVADTAARLAHAAQPHIDAASAAEVQALAHWVWGIACAIQGDMPAAVRALDAAAKGFQSINQRHPAAQTQVPKVMALAMMGQRAAATQCALAAQQELLACGDHATAAKVLLNVGNLNLRADLFTEATQHFRQARDLFTSQGHTEQAIMAGLGLADALVATGHLDEADQLYVDASTTAQVKGHAVLHAIAAESMALMNLLRGHYAQALTGLKNSLDRYAALDMPQHLAIAQKQLGDAYLQLRLLPESLRTYAAAQKRFDQLEMQVDSATTALQCARALAQLGKPAAASAAFEQARTVFLRCDHPSGAARVDLACAELALAQQRPAAAMAFAQAASGYFQSQSWMECELLAHAVQAEALLQQGQVLAAHNAFNATLSRAQQLHLLPAQLRCLTGRGLAAMSMGQSAAAMADLLQAGEWLEEQRRTLPGDEIRSAFQNQHQGLSQGLLRLTLAAHAGGQADAAQVLHRLDNTRARTLTEHLDLGAEPPQHQAAQGHATAPTTPDLGRLRSQLAWLYRRLRDNGDRAEASEALVAQLRQLEDELLEQSRRERLLVAAPGQTAAHSDWQVTELQRALGPDEAVLAYGVAEDELFACVVTRAQVLVCRALASWAEVEQTVRSMRFQIEALCHGNAALQLHLPAMTARAQSHLQQLHRLVWAPLARELHHVQHVVVVPQGVLSMVPFAALNDGQAYLAESLRFSVAPSARLALRALTQTPRPTHRVLVLADTERLGHAADEVAHLRSLMPQVDAFVGLHATGANLLQHGPAADAIHLACHAQFRGDNPLFSALHLADGPLTAEAIGGLQLRGAHVVLSACETALGDHREGEELFGLPRAFLRAGASAVVASLWPVDDHATAALMATYYQGLSQGLSPSAALQAAQRSARALQSHPFYWAAFSVIGRG